MKTSAIIELLLEPDPVPGPSRGHHHQPLVRHIVARLLEDGMQGPARLREASVHAGRRSRIFVATFTGPQGGQVWKTTGLTDYDQALKLAKEWEAQARLKRALLGSPSRKPGVNVPRTQAGAGTGLLTQREVAKLLRMSERGVREIEHRALAKLRRHPLLRQLWQDYASSELEENHQTMTPPEIVALFGLAITPQELRLIEKVLSAIHQ